MNSICEPHCLSGLAIYLIFIFFYRNLENLISDVLSNQLV